MTSPGWRPDQPSWSRRPQDAGIEVIGEPELAWRLRGPARRAWLGVTGTNGKTTTVGMLAVDPRRPPACEPWPPATSACRWSTPCSRSRPTTSWRSSCPASSCTGRRRCGARRPRSSTSPTTTSTGTARSTAYAARQVVDPAGRCARRGQPRRSRVRWRRAPVPTRARRLHARRAEPLATFGVAPAELVDTAASVARRRRPTSRLLGPHNVANALAAAALARAHGVAADGGAARVCAPSGPGGTATSRSPAAAASPGSTTRKATNPHAAAASLAAYPSVVWIAGGLLKGADVDDLVGRRSHRLRAVGPDRPGSGPDRGRACATRAGCAGCDDRYG